MGLCLLVFILLAGAAFIAGRWIKSPMADSSLHFFGGADEFRRPVERTPSPELPVRAPDVDGAVAHLVDNSLFVGVENVTFTTTYHENGPTERDLSYTGAEVEVLTTKDTRIYCDLNWQEASRGSQDRGVLQQEVTPCTLEDIKAEGGWISVWGARRGDRVVAEILLYMGF